MCLVHRNMSRRARIILALGYICIVTALALSHFSGGGNQRHVNFAHFLNGFLLGLTATLLSAATLYARRNQQS